LNRDQYRAVANDIGLEKTTAENVMSKGIVSCNEDVFQSDAFN
jgi:hypothetical protein